MKQVLIDNLYVIIPSVCSLLLSIINLGIVFFRTRAATIKKKANDNDIDIDNYQIECSDGSIYSMNEVRFKRIGSSSTKTNSLESENKEND